MNPSDPFSWVARCRCFLSGFFDLTDDESLVTSDEYVSSDSIGIDYMEPADLLALHHLHQWEHPTNPAEQAELQHAWYYGEAADQHLDANHDSDERGDHLTHYDHARHEHAHEGFDHGFHDYCSSWDSSDFGSTWGSSWD